MHCSRRRLLRRGLEFHVCAINKSAHMKKSRETYRMHLVYIYIYIYSESKYRIFRAQLEALFSQVYWSRSNKNPLWTSHFTLILFGHNLLTRTILNCHFNSLTFKALFYFHAFKYWFRSILMTLFIMLHEKHEKNKKKRGKFFRTHENQH